MNLEKRTFIQKKYHKNSQDLKTSTVHEGSLPLK